MTAFEALFVPGRVREAIAGQSWLDSMLRVEQALADAGARAGIVLDARSLLADSRRRARATISRPETITVVPTAIAINPHPSVATGLAAAPSANSSARPTPPASSRRSWS